MPDSTGGRQGENVALQEDWEYQTRMEVGKERKVALQEDWGCQTRLEVGKERKFALQED